MFNIFYWAESLTTLLHHADRDYAVHYDRRDLSRVFVRDRQGGIIEVPYRTRSYIPVTLEEQRWAVQKLRSANATVSEKGLFDAIEKRRLIVKNARKKTMRTRRSSQKTAYALQPSNRQPGTGIVESSTEASGPIEPYPVEIWE